MRRFALIPEINLSSSEPALRRSTLAYTLATFHSTPNRVQHVGLIPDGTRRWAKNHGVPLFDAYCKAMNQITQYIDYFLKEGCVAISVYLCSIENLKRTEMEISALFEAQKVLFDELLPALVAEWGTRVIVAGNVNLLPQYLRLAVDRTSKASCHYSSTRLYLCLAYNPLDEVLQAVGNPSSNGTFIDNLWVPEPLDLVIRTSGVNLLSNFLPLQAGYARIYTIDKLFNDTDISDFAPILSNFKQISRLYGE
jgi:undecaprenyl diphosphate synthase